jgi:hypothetical protein
MYNWRLQESPIALDSGLPELTSSAGTTSDPSQTMAGFGNGY